MAHYDLGAARYAKGDKEEAIAQYRRALEIDPAYVKARDRLGHRSFR